MICATTGLSAEYAITTKGDYSAGYREIGQLPRRWQPIDLPYTLPRQVSQQAKPNQLVTHWIRLDVDSKFKECFKAYVEPMSLFIPRWQTIGTLKVYADSQLLFASDSGPVWNGYNYPVWLEFKRSEDVPHKIILRLDSLQSAGLGLSNIYFQPSKSLSRIYFTRLWLQTKLPELASSAFLIIGVFALSIWLRRKNESIYGLFFIVTALSYMRCMQYYVGDEPLLISEEWFSWMVVMASGWLIIFTYAFCFRLHHVKFLRLEQLLVITMTLLTFVTMPWLKLTEDLGQILSFANLVIFVQLILFTGMMAIASWRSKSKEGSWLTLAHLLNVPLGFHDMMLQNYQINLESYYLLPYTILAPMFILMLIVRERYAHAMIEIENANKSLEFNLKKREIELHHVYEQKKITEQKQLLSQERVRLMKDMHDGFGSTLTTTMVLLKAGKIDSVQAVEYLEECINDLRLVIDSIEPTDSTFKSALINYSYRLHEKFAQVGIKCQRELDAIPDMPCLTPSDTLHVLRILQEVFVNILKHASATTVLWACKTVDNCIIFTIGDNGVSFDIGQVKKNRGIVNIQSRARLLQATVNWETKEVGTTFTMTIPIAGR